MPGTLRRNAPKSWGLMQAEGAPMSKSLNNCLCVLCIAAACVCLTYTVLLVLEIGIVNRSQAAVRSFFGGPGMVQPLHPGGV